jgi:large subunit ribosomal protein L35
MSNKMKTNKSALKRFRRTKNGKVKCMHANNHLYTGKTTKEKRQMRHALILTKADEKRIQKLIPYA